MDSIAVHNTAGVAVNIPKRTDLSLAAKPSRPPVPNIFIRLS